MQGLSTVVLPALALALAACTGLGQVENPAPNGPDAGEDVPDGVLCQAELSITGTLTPPGTPPSPDDGCVPLGTWTLDVALTDQGDCADVPFESQYVYEVTGNIDDGYTYTYVADPDADYVRLKITQEGGGCSGNFEHYAPDGTALLLLKPFETDLTITGNGYYETYPSSQL